MNLSELRARYEREEGYSRLNATARVCQDVILAKLASSGMRDRVTVKGGVLMCALSGSSRRATQDIDLDFVRYPMTDASIRSFVSALSRYRRRCQARRAHPLQPTVPCSDEVLPSGLDR